MGRKDGEIGSKRNEKEEGERKRPEHPPTLARVRVGGNEINGLKATHTKVG